MAWWAFALAMPWPWVGPPATKQPGVTHLVWGQVIDAPQRHLARFAQPWAIASAIVLVLPNIDSYTTTVLI